MSGNKADKDFDEEIRRDLKKVERKLIAEKIRRKPAVIFFPEVPDLIERGICPLCSKAIGEFRDALSKKEYEISGMCQECQDKAFGGR